MGFTPRNIPKQSDLKVEPDVTPTLGSEDIHYLWIIEM